jgi:uncharacterized protein YutE (UPF0331/DUF86 family)
MRCESQQLKKKAIESLINAVEFFNRPRDEGRVVAVLFFVQHSLEMLLKAAINEDRDTIFPAGENKSYSFDKCCGICQGDLCIIEENEAKLLQVINDLRDGATHHLVELSENALYSYAQGGIDVFEGIVADVFDDSLANHLPDRVLPLSTVPPKDIQMILREEIEAISELIAPGRRQSHTARPRLRHLLIVDAAVRDSDLDASDEAIDEVATRLRTAGDWRTVLPGAAVLTADPDGEGPQLSLRIERQGRFPVYYDDETQDPDVAMAYREVSELQRYPFGARKLAKKLPVSETKMLAVVEYLGLQDDPEYFKTIKIDASTFKRYSVKALKRLEAECRNNMLLEAAWAAWQDKRG